MAATDPPRGGPDGTRAPAGTGPAATSVTWHGAALTEAATTAAAKLAADGVAPALAAKDPDLWGPDAAAEAAIRLGWLDAPRASRALLGPLADLACRARQDCLYHIALAGMG